VLIDSFIR